MTNNNSKIPSVIQREDIQVEEDDEESDNEGVIFIHAPRVTDELYTRIIILQGESESVYRRIREYIAHITAIDRSKMQGLGPSFNHRFRLQRVRPINLIFITVDRRSRLGILLEPVFELRTSLWLRSELRDILEVYKHIVGANHK